MAHLWTTAGDGEWHRLGLDADAAVIDASGFRLVRDIADANAAVWPRIVLRRVGGAPEATWALLWPDAVGVIVNGRPSPLGLVVLADRDEIRVPGAEPMFFTTEALAAVEPFPDGAPGGCCPRCRQPIAVGTPAVRCPGCSLWYHQAADHLPCWTYADGCAACGRPTALDAGFSWTPAGL